jgi:hypothetical protein
MAELHQIKTTQDFESLAILREQFHDWIIKDFRIYICHEMSNEFSLSGNYDACLTVIDPYARFKENCVEFRFGNVTSINYNGISNVQAYLCELNFSVLEDDICIHSGDDAQLKITAAWLSVVIY